MNLQLAGRKAVVAGASRGLGRAIALALAAEGAAVGALARDAKRLGELAASVPKGHGTIAIHPGDLGSAATIEALRPVLAGADILVLNSGGPPPALIADTPDTVWAQHFETMFLSAVRLTRLALPGMRQRKFGRIIAVVSSGVVQPIPNLGISNSIRLALVGWAKTLAGEVAADGITVNCLAPGRIATERVAELDRARATREGIDVEVVEKQSRATIPLGRYGEPAEFAAVATFIAGAASSYITGSVIRVDGGMIRSI
jgi:3-oxoacyl-[acyl-carrier protein] reductase